jgi:hypothetical protein
MSEEKEIPVDASLLRCTVKKSINVWKKLVTMLKFAIIVILTAAAVIVAQYCVHLIPSSVIGIFSLIPWYIYGIIILIISDPIYSLFWCISKDFDDTFDCAANAILISMLIWCAVAFTGAIGYERTDPMFAYMCVIPSILLIPMGYYISIYISICKRNINVPIDASLLRCIYKRTISVWKKIISLLKYAIIGVLTVAAVIAIHYCIYLIPSVILSIFLLISWYIYVIVGLIVIVPLYSFFWCIHREFNLSDEDNGFHTAMVSMLIWVTVALTGMTIYMPSDPVFAFICFIPSLLLIPIGYFIGAYISYKRGNHVKSE